MIPVVNRQNWEVWRKFQASIHTTQQSVYFKKCNNLLLPMLVATRTDGT